MKRKLFLFGLCFLIIALALTAQTVSPQRKARVVQHRQTAVSPQVCEINGSAEFCTHLPILKLNTGTQAIPGEDHSHDRILAELTVWDGSQGNRLSDEPAFTTPAAIRYRGNSSLHFDKKSYSLVTLNDEGEKKKQSLLGMAAVEEWVLNGPFLDKTLMRNYIAMNVAGQIMDYAPNVRYCELFVDDQYQGVYLLMEQISRSEERINVTEINEKLQKTGYIVRLDRKHDDPEQINTFTDYTYILDVTQAMDVKYPGTEKLTEPLRAFIERDLGEVEKALYSFDYDSRDFGYRQLLDVDSFVDYFIINEFFRNVDAGSYSTYLYRSLGGKVGICVWDFNNMLDNYQEIELPVEGFFMPDKPWFFMLCKDEYFIERVIQRYKLLRQSVLSETALLAMIDETQTYLGPAIERNFEVWGYTFERPHELETDKSWQTGDQAGTVLNEIDRNYLQPLSRNPRTYEEAVNAMKAYLSARGTWMDEHIDSLRHVAHESVNKKYNH